ncbi:hypothetical protein JX265_011150 [Neoarthrinium moseri]|uniref:Rhodopsin domain-containing protein n=1 Tax=Neoarthrinium moseri TaxID=1658444 RepID=A0A9P9WCI0_9PEZI|nr:hypothetical protein JX265_011150 [Neoarthrinium moseri]
MSVVNGVAIVLPPPEGFEVDFANPTRNLTLVRQTYWIYGIGTALALFFLVQNLYVKLYVNRRVDTEAGCLIASWIMSQIVQALLISTVAAKLTGTHAWEMSLEKYNYWTLIFYVSSTIYTPTTGLAKLSLLCFYNKVSPARWWIWCTRISIFVLAGYTVAITFAMLFACNPIRRSWDVTMTEGECVNRPYLYIAIAALQILSDVGLIIMPMPMIYGLQMPSRQKIGLVLMFVVGSSTLVTSIMRLVTLVPALSDADQTWALSQPVLWICVEGNLLTICASFPTAKRFFRLVAPRWIGESETKRSSRNNGLDQQGPSQKHAFHNEIVPLGDLKLGDGEPIEVTIQGGKGEARLVKNERDEDTPGSGDSISSFTETGNEDIPGNETLRGDAVASRTYPLDKWLTLSPAMNV